MTSQMRTLSLLLALIVAGPAGAQQAAAVAPSDSVPTFELHEVERGPQPLNTREFQRALLREYPPALRDAGQEGIVQVRFRVEIDGSTSGTYITRTSHPAFAEPTLRAVQLLRFRPARRNGRPVRAWVELPINWAIGDRRQVAPAPPAAGDRSP
jgi:TonB family protein